MQKYTGVHIVLDIFGCVYEQLENQTYLVSLMEKLTDVLGTNVIVETCHKFSPQGISMVLIISASHITVHTWPEDHYVGIDIFTCEDTDYNVEQIEKYFKEKLICNRIKSQKIYRGLVES